MLKILAIGNSFSTDATRYFKAVADSVGEDMIVVNLFIGGCSLERHASNVASGEAAYLYELNGESTQRYVSLQEAIAEQAWDIVTVQQASKVSGIAEAYEPFGSDLLKFVRTNAPQAKIFFHMTWAYELDSAHKHYGNYNHSQQLMYEMIVEASEQFARNHDLGMIPCGKAIQAIRKLPAFDYANGGLSLCRDGHHMSLDYGRYALACTWTEVLLGANVLNAGFAPEGTDPVLLAQIRQTVHDVCQAEQ